jgi:hypothetical protein
MLCGFFGNTSIFSVVGGGASRICHVINTEVFSELKVREIGAALPRAPPPLAGRAGAAIGSSTPWLTLRWWRSHAL